ncbi:hypothetical protein M430DRAFT_103237 [Amorphotheca resinae ATCC 22711]|jgi:2,5-diamino-6-(ribosylamino)-4(3H)-pyrimidinone 5'-phosphate reductase|uniref:2,5-diamino-6-ribosylamino-4(3H)-pyrimidinone 5'-phosphate reductase n=1 Tax=Amorphotheca resinae ATCC 22711 TaxID=857342 RepID=A0A2T3B0Y1_AMORE|nr:hypothetical protein M430DRAFT_103237 [Amorphotheca resinae ATCC 22711]PSS17060.1 hypothetical protein M430DRAFT_103237 [Amorphotheca resinae ATCC 22711]
MARDTLYFPASDRLFLEPYLPPKDLALSGADALPFTTLTFATSLDSQLALSPGARTVLSGPQSKAMTHYLRSRHDAILIGVGTAVADNPGLNCRIEGAGGYGGDGLEGQPRPIIVDPKARWDFTENQKIFELARDGRGKAPFIITAVETPPADKEAILEKHGGKFIRVGLKTTVTGEYGLYWKDVLKALAAEGLGSVMIEGGGAVINSLLVPENFEVISSVIITIAPTWLGRGGVVVSPERQFDGNGSLVPSTRLKNVMWHPFGEDVVMCGNLKV